MEFLLLPKEKVFMRSGDNCLDIVTSPDRSKLLEKFLSKRYTLLSETSEAAASNSVKTEEHCQLEMKTTRARKVDSINVRVGRTNDAQASNRDLKETSTAQILLGMGKPGSLDLEGKALFVECRQGLSGIYQLIFSFTELNRTKVTSEVSLRKNEPLSIAQIVTDLNSKSKTLGLPETIIQEAEGKDSTTFELQIK